MRSAADLVELSADEQRAMITASEDDILKKAAEIRARRGEEKAQNRAAMLFAQRQTPKVEPAIVKAHAVEWLSGLKDRSVDLLLTDPPYWTHVPDITQFAAGWLPLALTKLKDTGRAYIFVGYYAEELAAYLPLVLSQTRFEYDLLGWTYRNTLGPQPTMGYMKNLQAVVYLRGKKAAKLESPNLTEQFSVADMSAPDGRHGTRFYHWEKPYDLAERYIRHSTKVGDIVADPFVGSGTFMLAAGNLGRRGIGCDNDDAALAIACERLCGEAGPLGTLPQPAADALKVVGATNQ
jgi:site-specific DNA-methyltransferase (adenine-specific)